MSRHLLRFLPDLDSREEDDGDMEVYDSSFWSEFLRGMLKPAAATAVVAMAVALSFVQRLGLEWEMVYSIARTFLQLSVIGFVLEFIFTQKNAGWIVLAYLFMVSIL